MLSRKSTPALALLLLVTLGASHQSAWAQSGLVAPRPMNSPQPPQPTNAQGQPTEGWVIVRYTVLEDGTPADVRAVDMIPSSIDPAPTIEAVNRWTFVPGMRDGEPIDWHNNESVVIFRSQTGSPPIDEAFEEGYESIRAMIESEDFDAALDANRELLDKHATQLDEIGLALAQASIIQIGREDFHSSLMRVRQTTDERIPILADQELFVALQLRMQVEGELGRIHEALESYERITHQLGDTELDPSFTNIGKQLRASWESTQFIPVTGRIDDRPWRIDAARRYFYVDDIEGSIGSIDIECDTRHITIEFQQDADYQLPDSFGNCVVFLDGDPGTTFKFVEVLPEEE